MSLGDSLRIAVRALVLQRLRTMLAMLGVIIGITAVIALLSVGTAASDSVTSKVSGLGARVIDLTPMGQSGVTLDAADASWLLRRVREISAAAPIISGSVTSYQGGKTWSTTLIGTTPGALAIEGRSVAIGRDFTRSETANDASVAVIGSTTAKKLFSGSDPIGRQITVDGVPLTIVGEMQTEGTSQGFGQDPDDEIVVPISLAQDIIGTSDLSMIVASARSASYVPLAVGHLEAVLDTRFGTTDAANVQSAAALGSTLSSITSILTLLLAGIAGISLLVGGIGIMNIMLVTVAERTREIGLRKAIGAKNRDISLQFLLEACLLSVTGGLIGAGAGIGGGILIERAFGWSPLIDWQGVTIALAFSVAVGILFGLWPALRASALDPVEALRSA